MRKKHIRLRKTAALERKFWARVAKGGENECWPWTGAMRPNGYGRFKLSRDEEAQSNRLAYVIATGEDPGPLFVLHSCNNFPCCNPAHLFLGMAIDQVRNMQAKGRDAYVGEENGSAKLSAGDVHKIRARLQKGETNVDISAGHAVTHHMISRIRRGLNWKRENSRGTRLENA